MGNAFRKLMSDAKFYESYSRYDSDLNRYETWNEAVDRVMGMHRRKYAHKMVPELSDLIDFATREYKDQSVLGAQRALQFGGKQLEDHNIKIYNCVSSHCNRPAFFGEFMYMLLCGAGAGFSVQKHHVAMLPEIAHRSDRTVTHIVEDSIEGWAKAVDVLLSSYFVDGGKHPEFKGTKINFDLNLIRPKGAEISGGFLAPGPDPLRKALDKIEHLLETHIGRNYSIKMTPIICYDICMFGADAVISGGREI